MSAAQFVEGVVNIVGADDEPTGDTMMAWSHGEKFGLTPRHGVDIVIDGRRVQVSVTRKRKLLRIFVDGKEWSAPVGKVEGE